MDKNILDWFSCGTCTDEMKWLQDLLFEIDLSKLDLQRGIYFLYLGEELQYIGQSINVLTRIGNHRRDKEFDRVFFLPVHADSKVLEYIEMRFISFYNPPLNKTCRADYHYSANDIAEALEQSNVFINMTRKELEKVTENQKQSVDNYEMFLNETFDSALRKKCLEMFDSNQWLGSRRYKDIKKRFLDIVNKGYSASHLRKTIHDLVLNLVVAEYRLEKINEQKTLDDLEREKAALLAEIEDLKNLKKIKKYWSERDRPDLVA